MATGDQQDFANRLRGLLPGSWFGTGLTVVGNQEASAQTPVLDTLMAGMAYPLAWDYVLFNYVLLQSRIKTATGVWLDRISYDFCGTRLPRLIDENDDAYRTRIIAEILRPRQTRAGISKALVDLTGQTPKIVELWNPGDTGAYGTAGCQGYGHAGMYGSLQYRNQVFITAYRPSGEGIPNIGGYGNPQSGYGTSGQGEYADLSDVIGAVKDRDIYASVAGIVAGGITGWTAIQSKPDTVDAPTAYFGNVSNTQLLVTLPYFF